MTVFRIVQAATYLDFAQFGAVGTWSEDDESPCCGRSTQDLVAPLQIMWIPGSDVIGDFAWGSFVSVIRDRVVKTLRRLGVEKSFLPVEHIPYDGSAGRRRKKDSLVQVPYDGPRLRWLHVPADVHVDLEASGVEIQRRCAVCGYAFYRPGLKAVEIQASGWRGQHVFRIAEFEGSNATYVTETGREALAEFSNIKFIPFGRIRER